MDEDLNGRLHTPVILVPSYTRYLDRVCDDRRPTLSSRGEFIA